MQRQCLGVERREGSTRNRLQPPTAREEQKRSARDQTPPPRNDLSQVPLKLPALEWRKAHLRDATGGGNQTMVRQHRKTNEFLHLRGSEHNEVMPWKAWGWHKHGAPIAIGSIGHESLRGERWTTACPIPEVLEETEPVAPQPGWHITARAHQNGQCA